MHIKQEAAERHTLAVIVDNQPGILARIAGLFTARGYNIESLTVSEITEDKAVSRLTIVTSASPPVMEQIIAQLERLVPVHKVTDLTVQGAHVERELALVKVAGTGDHRIEALRLAEVYRARVVDATTASFVFEVTGGREKIDSFVELMAEVGLVEVARTGIVAIGRGAARTFHASADGGSTGRGRRPCRNTQGDQRNACVLRP
ncbi:acetolactate synthase, small subunit [Sphingomonas gellani]|uniref:acetolactate synthase n=1 Tax=Sphingomonas gellani TaxID=1166340 RepID=A0A1H7Y620_9SPHN|nr:acetolactate synthase, small subunit [Sphingomonas gellani]